jgi:hypothetical protein
MFKFIPVHKIDQILGQIFNGKKKHGRAKNGLHDAANIFRVECNFKLPCDRALHVSYDEHVPRFRIL